MNEIIHAAGWTLIHFLWQGALVGLAAATLLWLMRGARPAARYGLACAAMLACLLWPAFEFASALQATPHSLQALVLAGGADTFAQSDLLASIDNRLPLLVAAWLACVGALALRSVLGLAWIARARRTGGRNQHWQQRLSQLAARLGIRREVGLRIVEALASPITAGWWRPVVLVPAALVARMPPELLEALLAHELAHVRRHDYLVNLLQNVVETLLFYHPAVWWLSRRIRHERELVADGIAAQLTGEPRRLALALSELEKMQFASQRLALAADGGDLMQRIRHLMLPPQQRSNWKGLLAAFGITAACLAGYANARVDAASVPAARTPAVVDFRSCAKPLWPQEDLQAEHTGAVTLSFRINAKGDVTGSRVVRSSGHVGLDKAAQNGIGKCRFSPAKVRGKPVESWQQMQYVWTLD
ncbi:TonB family C-terminal domain-containing protein [Duganella sp. CF458]|uniref:M56 family metallopeptidase n=1 Tax=Duganella sp. CF458 TaxID=1884368 RepID=UPI0008EA261C|nr:M56 family metallopeptidase [Duganella sp. CF458]SFG18786.1 TonB family C-terminal domain-containing protein [Duganella sp. CF458]